MYFKLIIILIIFIIPKFSSKMTPVLVYHKDMSEYCRRQVVPSVFVGRHVTGANSEILQFTKLDLPYTCHISVRIESGFSMILVSELISYDHISDTCAESPNQLIVFEMGETFGGYWGPLPDDLIHQKYSDNTKYYTLQTTERDSGSSEPNVIPDKENDSLKTTLKESTPEEDEIVLEMPIVNVSASFLPGDNVERDIDDEKLFELVYDVTPGSEMNYDTNILPLVQYSINGHKMSKGFRDSAENMIYSVTPVTPDKRLTYPMLAHSTVKRKPWKKQKHNANSRINFKKHIYLYPASTSSIFYKYPHANIQHPLLSRTNMLTKLDKQLIQTNKAAIIKYAPASNKYSIPQFEKPWEKIDYLNETSNKSNNFKKAAPVNISRRNFMSKISEMKHNFSVHLVPNLSIYDKVSTRTYKPLKTKYYITSAMENNRISNITARNQNVLTVKMNENQERNIYNSTSAIPSTLFYGKENSSISEASLVETVSPNIYDRKSHGNSTVGKHAVTIDPKTRSHTYSNTNQSYVLRSPKLSGSLVDRESWENIVQSAPEMADLLNVTRDDDTDHMNKIKRRRKKRKKRMIHVIAIEENRPRSWVPKATATTSEIAYNVADMQELAELVELKDDELHDRVAFRHYKQYYGPILYNICDSHKPSKREVYLFNASRIVLYIENFTMQSMTIILTPARTMLTSQSHCSKFDIECQVGGTRVCIDSLTACDGIPNCGSYDIYDEDHVMCGRSLALQHNVYLAAFTFLAVILTILYIIHYWLKQYIPKVSEAFFIYVNGIENILHLDSIMRHPTNSEDDIFYNQNIAEYDIFCSTEIKPKKRNILKILIKVFKFDCLRKKRNVQEDIFLDKCLENEIRYSKKELANMCVQTGDSLEMAQLAHLNIKNDHNKPKIMPTISEVEGNASTAAVYETTLDCLKDYSDELSLLSFCKQSRSDSIPSSIQALIQSENITIKTSATNLERVIGCHEYDTVLDAAGPSTKHTNMKDNDWPKPVKKHLRFNETATIIPSMTFEEIEDDSEDNISHRNINSTRSKRPESKKIENSSGSCRSFWGKSKKQKNHSQYPK